MKQNNESKEVPGTLENCSLDKDPLCEYKSVVECGECGKEFNTNKELDKHDKEMHPPKPETPLPEEKPALCEHLHVTVEFSGLNHMDIESASGYFKEVCKKCGKQVGKEYLIEFTSKQHQ